MSSDDWGLVQVIAYGSLVILLVLADLILLFALPEGEDDAPRAVVVPVRLTISVVVVGLVVALFLRQNWARWVLGILQILGGTCLCGVSAIGLVAVTLGGLPWLLPVIVLGGALFYFAFAAWVLASPQIRDYCGG
jgi:hypothetical protein